MAWLYKFLGFLLLILLTSCSLVPSGSQPTESTAVPTSVASTPAYPAPETPIVPSTTLFPDLPTLTSTPDDTATPEKPTLIPTITPAKPPGSTPTAIQNLLDVQIGSPLGISNFAHPELGCQWMGVAGQVFDTDGTPLEELVIEFGGTLAGEDVFGLTISGQTDAYGSGGYEFKLADSPVASKDSVWVRVYDFNGVPLSRDTYISTYDNCEQNLILLNFVQAYQTPTDWVYLPLIFR